jgi:hypothetical protein
VLVALRTDGERLQIAGLSEGACNQLFLHRGGHHRSAGQGLHPDNAVFHRHLQLT